MNKSNKPISAIPLKNYNIQIKYLEQVDKVEILATRKSSCYALIHSYNSQSTLITNIDKMLELLHERLNELTYKIKYDWQENKLILLKDKESFINWNDIIATRDRIIDSFERLIISLYTYIPPRR